ncbi:MAG: hypothetical protein Q9209_004080 [Squamulea sp. 1 TL-2023]
MDQSNNGARSALYGKPPVTDNDYWVVKAILFQMGLADADPVQGLPLEYSPPSSNKNHSGSIIAGVTVSIFLIVSITVTRLVAKKTIRTSSLGWDDALISIAALAGVACFGLVGAMVSNGAAGHHLLSITYEQYYWLTRLGTVAGMVHYVTAGFTKFAIIFFNVRLTGLTSDIWSLVHRVCFVVVLAWLLTALFGSTLGCKPYASVTSLIVAGKAVPTFRCNSHNRSLGLALQIAHALLDWVLLAVPIIILIPLKMAWQRKVQCTIPLAVGTLSAAGASKRIYDQYHPHWDISPDYFASQLPWTIVDMVCAICVTSLPTINNLLIHYLPKHFSQYWSGGDPASSPSGESLHPSHGIRSPDPVNAGISSGAGSSIDETKGIMVQRDIDLESMRTDIEESPDPRSLFRAE